MDSHTARLAYIQSRGHRGQPELATHSLSTTGSCWGEASGQPSTDTNRGQTNISVSFGDSAASAGAQVQLTCTCKHTQTRTHRATLSSGHRSGKTTFPHLSRQPWDSTQWTHTIHHGRRYTAPPIRYVYTHTLDHSHTRALTPLCVMLTPSHNFPPTSGTVTRPHHTCVQTA